MQTKTRRGRNIDQQGADGLRQQELSTTLVERAQLTLFEVGERLLRYQGLAILEPARD
jgi:hypothetical protein